MTEKLFNNQSNNKFSNIGWIYLGDRIDDNFCQIDDVLYRMNYNDITYNEFINIHTGKYGLEKVKRI